MDPVPASLRPLLDELQRRRVVRSVLAYAAAVFALLQGAQPVFDGLLLPDLAFRFLVILCLAGFPIVAVLAWVYELTADGIRKTGKSTPDPQVRQRVPLRRWIQVAGIFLMASVLAASTAVGLGRLSFPAAADDGRVALAVFPFRVASGDAEWSEGAADLLATALDGTVGLRVVDPWALWRPLRPRRESAADPPEPDQAARIAQDFEAHRFLLGSAVASGDRLDLNVRIYQVGRADPIATFTVDGDADDLAGVVRAAATGVLTRVWGPRRPPDLPGELDFDATASPDALKAYLAAKAALRRGQLDSADIAIDRALALDSTFVLGLVDAVVIKSWTSFARGQPYAGFFQLLDRAEAVASKANVRTRLRLEGVRASVETDGQRANAAARRILEIDPTDLAALSSLNYYDQVYGWQYGALLFAHLDRAERVVQLDSTSVTALATRAHLAVSRGDTADMRTQLGRFLFVDTTSTLGRGWTAALRGVLAGDSSFAADLPALATLPGPARNTVLRALRHERPDRAALFLQALSATSDPQARALGVSEMARLRIARGETGPIAKAIAAGEYHQNDMFRVLQAQIVAASLADIGDATVAGRAAGELAAYVTPDSAAAQIDTRPVWWYGWLIGAYHATFGDAAVAERWIEAIGTLRPGGSSQDYRGALQSDIRARLASRRGDVDRAIEEAHRAFDLWSIHTENQIEALPEPAMRFHLGLLYLRAGQPDRAHPYFASLVPPTTWMGFLTARASFELGDIEQARGDRDMAVFHYTRALRLLEGGESSPWLDRVRERLGGVVRG